jgi:eukaryotic-like serine/threonine-protein kinase
MKQESGHQIPAAVEPRDYDTFYLNYLQSVRADNAWYLNQHFIGRGGNGTTFFVTCTSGENFGFQFALKVFHRISDMRRRERFLEETRHYRTLSHPSIVKIYDEGTFRSHDREYPFAVIDYIPENLEMKLGRGSPKTPRFQALRYIMNVGSGVAYLHGQTNPIVHRDIKPGNILVNGPTARLGDLGLAKVLMEPGTGSEAEGIGEIAAYVAMPRFYRTPELVSIARGEETRLTTASDIYQLGLVLYQSLTGYNPQKPAPREDPLEKIQLDLREIRGVRADELNSLIGRMLKDAPAEGPTALDVLDRLNIVHREICQANLDATGVMS